MFEKTSRTSEVVIRDCRGVIVDQFRQEFAKGLHRLWAPESGLIILNGQEGVNE